MFSPAAAAFATFAAFASAAYPATCRGPSVELMYAAPSDGWGYRRESAPRQLLAVEFLRPGRRSHLVVRCSGGAPVRAVNAVESTHSVSDGEGSGD